MLRHQRRVLHVEGTGTDALKWDHAWCVHGTVIRPVWLEQAFCTCEFCWLKF